MATITVTQSGPVVVGDNDQVDIEIPNGGTVTIEADPNDNVDKLTIDFHDDAHSDEVIIDLSTFSEDGLRIDIKKYDPSDKISFINAFDYYVDPADPSRFTFSYIGADGQIYTGYIQAMDGGERDFLDPTSPITIICFADGTLIDTPRGPVPVETLRPGDMVTTLDSGPLPLRWVGRREIDGAWLRRMPQLAPVMVPAGAFGPGLPSADLVLSPNHRILLRHALSDMLFGETEVLAAAKHLLDRHVIPAPDARNGVAYNHLLFDQHEIVFANGLPSESLYPGPEALGALDDDALAEIRAIFPEALDPHGDAGRPARRILRGFEAETLARAITGHVMAA